MPTCEYLWKKVTLWSKFLNLLFTALTHSSWDRPLRFFTQSSWDRPLLHIFQCLRGCWGNLGNMSSLCMFWFQNEAARCPHVYVYQWWDFPMLWRIWTRNWRKRSDLVKFSDFWRRKKDCQFAVAWESGAIHAQIDKNDASNGLILGYEVLQKCSNLFSPLDLKLSWKKVWSPHITRRFPRDPGASE